MIQKHTCRGHIINRPKYNTTFFVERCQSKEVAMFYSTRKQIGLNELLKGAGGEHAPLQSTLSILVWLEPATLTKGRTSLLTSTAFLNGANPCFKHLYFILNAEFKDSLWPNQEVNVVSASLSPKVSVSSSSDYDASLGFLNWKGN